MSKRKPALRIGGGVLNRNTLSNTEKSVNVDEFKRSAPAGGNKVSTQSGGQNNIDTEVANFLKEIDECAGTGQVTETATNEMVKIGDWQQCIDEKTQHPYYWNTVTDEVTWVLPEEITSQFQVQTEKTDDSSHTEVKKDVASEEPKEDEEPKEEETEPKKQMIKLVADYESELKDDAEEDSAHDSSLDSNEKMSDVDIDRELDSALENTKNGLSLGTTVPKSSKIISGLRDSPQLSPEHDKRHCSSAIRNDDSMQCSGEAENKQSPEHGKSSSEVTELSQILFRKMNFLGISKTALINLHVLLIEIETRMTDWKDNELSTSYVLTKLQEADQQLKNYEESATPAGWSCHWDSSAERYFYMNEKTRKKQWQYPEIRNSQNLGSNETDDQGKATSEAGSDDNVPAKKARSTHSPTSQKFSSPPPLPATPQEKPPLPPQPPDDGFEVGEDGEEENSDDDGIMMEISDGEKEKEEEEKKLSTASAIMSQQPVLYQGSMTNNSSSLQSVHTAASLQTHSKIIPLTKSRASSEPKSVPKNKRKKAKSSKKPSVVKKPSKGISSLVAKWQRAKNEIEEEDRMFEEDDEEESNQHDMAQNQIEKWKQEQIASGRSLSNANFEPVPDDWRSRLLEKKRKKV